MATMKAAVYERYGGPEVVQVREVTQPEPGNKDVLIRVHATTVCAADWRLRRANPAVVRLYNGLLRPRRIRTLGMEFSGTVEAVGKDVKRFAAGDEVFGGTMFKMGTHAEFVCIDETGPIAKKPANMSLDDAAAVFFGGMTVTGYLGNSPISNGQKVLVYGASGSVGVFAVQVAKAYGAHVTAVCSGANAEMMRSLGADEVVDYTREDFANAGRIYDMVVDCVGFAGFWRSLSVLKRGSSYLMIAGIGKRSFVLNMLGGMSGGLWARAFRGVKVVGMPKRGNPLPNLILLKELIEAGKVRTWIDRRYSLNQIAEAHRHAEGMHKKGHVLVTIP